MSDQDMQSKSDYEAPRSAASAADSDQRIAKLLTQALNDIFGTGQSSGRFIDVTRIPLICKSIIDTNAQLKEMNEKLDTKYVTNDVFLPVKSLADKFGDDVEKRLRSLEKTQTQILTWGSISVVLIGIVEFLVLHFLK